MSNTNPYTYIHTGLLIRLLMHAQGFSVDAIIGEGKKLKSNLKLIDFRVSSQGLFDLNKFITRRTGSDLEYGICLASKETE